VFGSISEKFQSARVLADARPTRPIDFLLGDGFNPRASSRTRDTVEIRYPQASWFQSARVLADARQRKTPRQQARRTSFNPRASSRTRDTS